MGDYSDTGADTIVYFDRARLAGLTGCCIFLTLLGVFLFWSSQFQTEVPVALMKTFCLGMTLLFGLLAGYYIHKLVRSRPGIILASQGITDNSNLLGAGFIAWQEITGIETKQTRSTAYIAIHVADPEVILCRHSPWKKWLMRLNLWFGGSPVNIATRTLACPLNALETELHSRWQESRTG